MFGNGVMICMELVIMQNPHLLIRRDPHLALTVCCVVVAGGAIRGTADLPVATEKLRSTGITATVFVLPFRNSLQKEVDCRIHFFIF